MVGEEGGERGVVAGQRRQEHALPLARPHVLARPPHHRRVGGRPASREPREVVAVQRGPHLDRNTRLRELRFLSQYSKK